MLSFIIVLYAIQFSDINVAVLVYDKVLLSNVAECDTVNVTVCDISLLLYVI